MSRWAESIREFSQLLTPDGKTYDLHTASRNGRWVISNQGYGMPGIDYVVQSHPFQHGATVRDYRLTPRTIQLLLHQSFCDREALWAGRSGLIESLRPNRTSTGFLDYWLSRSQGGVQESVYGNPQLTITSLCEYNGLLYGATGPDGSGSGGLLLVWDGGSSWSVVAGQPSATDGATTEIGTAIQSLAVADMVVPIFSTSMSLPMTREYYNAGEDGHGDITSPAIRLGQIFTPTIDFYLTGVRVKLYKVGNPNGLYIYIYATAGGHPVGSPLAASSMNALYITTSTGGQWYDFATGPGGGVWTGNPLLEVGTQYAIVLAGDGYSTGGNYEAWLRDESAPAYAAGCAEYSSDSGASWVSQAYDYMFETYGTVEVTTKTSEESRHFLIAGCGTEAIVTPWDGVWNDAFGALHYAGEDNIWSILPWGGKVYCATGGTGLLLRYDIDLITGLGSFVLCAVQLTADNVYCLAAYDDGGGEAIFGGTDEATLVKWNGATPGIWTEEADTPAGQTAIRALVVYQSLLFGASAPDGILYKYDVGGSAWVAVTASLGATIYALAVYKGRLYGSGEDGKLYRWNNLDDWEQVCDIYGTEEVRSMALYQNRLFAGTYDEARLLEYTHDIIERKPACTTLRRVLANGQVRDLCVFITAGPQFDANNPGEWQENSFEELLRFTAYNPVMYDPVQVAVPYLIPPGSVSESEDIIYTGTWEEHPTLILTGPLDNPFIIHKTLDDSITLDYNIPDGDVVTIDLSNLTVKDNHNVNLLGAVTPESNLATFRLEPDPVVTGGINPILIVAGGATANSDFEITYFRRFIGI